MDSNINWTNDETNLLTKLYNDDELELLEICRIMKKKCKVIIAKLLELGIVKSKNDVRGTNLTYTNQTNQTNQTNTDENWTTIKVLNNVNQIVQEVSKFCTIYSNLVNQLNRLSNETQSKNKT
jgi:ERCC4-related helicase